MIPQQWTPPCNNQCTHKCAARIQIPYLSKHSLGFPRESILKKGCDSDGDTWEDCLGECDEICYKDPVLKDRQWSAYIDRSPVAASYLEECFRACVDGYGYKFYLPSEKVKSSSFKETIKASHGRETTSPTRPAVESKPPRQSGPADCHLAFLHS